LRADVVDGVEIAAGEPRGRALQERRRISGARMAFLMLVARPCARRGVVLSGSRKRLHRLSLRYGAAWSVRLRIRHPGST
jgi:hypothetical protein